MPNQPQPSLEQVKEYNRLDALLSKYRRYLKYLQKTSAPETKIDDVVHQLANIEAAIEKIPEHAQIPLKQVPPPPAPREPSPRVPRPVPPSYIAPYAKYEIQLYRSMSDSLKRLRTERDAAYVSRAARGDISALDHLISVTKFNMAALSRRIRVLQTGALHFPDPGLIQASAGVPIAGVAYLYATTRKAVETLVTQALQTSPGVPHKVLYAQNFAFGSDVELTSREPDLTVKWLTGRGVSYSNGLSVHFKGKPTGALTQATLFGAFPTPELRFLTAAIITRSAHPELIREATFELRAQYPPIVHWPGISHQGEHTPNPIRLNTREGWAPAGELTFPMPYPSAWRIYAFAIDMRKAWYTQAYGANYPLAAFKIPYRYLIQDNIVDTVWNLTLDFYARRRYVLDLDSVLIVNYGEQLYLR